MIRSRPAKYRIAVRRIPDGGGGSIEVHDALPVGSIVTTSGPRNAFPLSVPGYGSPTQRPTVHRRRHQDHPDPPDAGHGPTPGRGLVHGVRRPQRSEHPLLDEVRTFGDRIEIRTDDVHGIPSADDLLGECRDGTTVYACGPADMISLVRSDCRAGTTSSCTSNASPPLRWSTARHSRSRWRPPVRAPVAAEETLLAALRRTGVAAPYSCQQGFCGTCRTKVLNGVVQHRDTLLTSPERERDDAHLRIPRTRR